MALLLFVVPRAQGQTSTGALRYLHEVFTDVNVTTDVVYGSNVTVLPVLQALMPTIAPLVCDIYEPAGDTEVDRPLLIYIHTGNFLPQYVNGSAVGSKSDSVAVELCSRYAKMGYVVASIDYRLGWNPLAPTQSDRTYQFINAVYRGMQDARTAVRYFRMSEATMGDPYGIDPNMIGYMGEGTGGYISYAASTIGDYIDIILDDMGAPIAKFWYDPGDGSLIPMVIEAFNGDPEAISDGYAPPGWFGPDAVQLCVANHVGYNSDVAFQVNLGGALGDLNWLDAGDPAMISFQSPVDQSDPYTTGVLVVPTTNETVVEVSGAYDTHAEINGQAAPNNNASFQSLGLSDVFSAQAVANGNMGWDGLYPVKNDNVNGVPTQPYDGAPWQWWDVATTELVDAANGTTIAATQLTLNPNMGPLEGRAYCDTIVGYAAPRMAALLGLASQGPGCTDATACNFNALATSDDGSCDYSCAGCLDPNACNYDASSTIPGYEEGLLTIAVGGGSWDSEITWQILNAQEELVIEGGAPFSGEIWIAPGVYTLMFADVYCDGWNGAGMTLETSGGTQLFTLEYGCSESFLFVPELEVSGCTDVTACNYDPSATDYDGNCDYCSCSEPGAYPLTVESFPATQEGLTTYRFYVNMSDPTDRMSAVYGNSAQNMFIETPDGAFNSAANTGWNASGINPAFLTVFPELVDDTYATIGLTGPAATSGLTGAADPAIVEDSSQPVTPYFLTSGATTLESNSLIGSSWYVLNTATNGLPDADMRVIIMQVTTSGSISGTLNYQVFPLGVGNDADIRTVDFNGAGTFATNCGILGCTDPIACNYCAAACVPDGSCTYIAEGDCDCDGNVLDVVGVCGGDCSSDEDGNGICDDAEIPGCINSSACNYNPDASIGDGSCEFPATGTCCGGGADFDGDGVCDNEEILGCDDAFACNFNPSVTEQDGSCEYCECTDEGYTLTVESSPAIQAGLTTYRVFVNLPHEGDFLSAVYSNADEPMVLDVPDGAYNDPNSTVWSAVGINPALFMNSPNLQDDSYATIGLTVSASLLEVGYQNPSLAENSEDVEGFFTQNGSTNLAVNTNPGSAWYVLNGATNGYADASGRVLIMQVTTSGEFSGTLNYQVFPAGIQDNALTVTASFEGVGTFGQTIICGCMQANACNYAPAANISDGSCEYESCNGCMDETACNFDGTATLDDGTTCEYVSCQGCTDGSACNFDETAVLDDGTNCVYPEPGFNCDGSCVDLNNNGTCDFNDVSGCTIPFACNFNPSANLDDGSCSFNDADNDGVCDGDEVVGCLDGLACNFDPDATEHDSNLCEYESCAGCLDPAACNFDETATIDEGCEYESCVGCTDPNACNFDVSATWDSGCEYSSCAGCTIEEACNYDPEASIDNGSCDFLECLGCTDPESCNFNAEASVDDGSCDGLALQFEVIIDECPNPHAEVVVQDASPWSGTLQLSAEGVNVFADGGVAITEIEGIPFELTQGVTYLVSGISDSGCEQLYPLHIPYGKRSITPYPSVLNDNGVVPGAVALDSIKGGTPPLNVRWYRVPEDPLDPESAMPWGTLLFENQLDSLDPGLYRVVGKDALGCVGDSVVEVLDVAVYACLDPDAYNFNPEGTVDDGSCIYFEETCEFIGEDDWEFLPQGIYPNDTTSWFLGDSSAVDLVFSLPTFVVEPAGATFLTLHWTLNSVSGLPDGLSVSGLVDSLGGGVQDCFQVEGVPLAMGTYQFTITGDLVVQFFGTPFQIDNYQLTHTIQVLPNPNPIPGCTYPFAWNYLVIANLDDGSCLIPGCADSTACNYQPLASFIGVEACDYSCLGCTYDVALNYTELATLDDGSCLFDASPVLCPQDLSGDNNIGSADLLILLSEFGIPCTP